MVGLCRITTQPQVGGSLPGPKSCSTVDDTELMPKSQLDQLETDIAAAMVPEQFGLRSRLARIRRNLSDPHVDRQIQQLAQRVEESITRRAKRQAAKPEVRFDLPLPVLEWRDEIVSAIRDHQVVIISGETGSGKSTQLPKICLEMGRGVDGMIGLTQPRRLAARSIATRLADELRSPLGRDVGYKIRFAEHVRKDSYIKLMTDGILLAETTSDRFLNQYDTIILDEAHERSLNIDFLVGYLKRLLPKRPELRCIVTSATIDAKRFSEHFSDGGSPAPVIEVSGRNYPVDVRYRPWEESDEADEPDLADQIVSAVAELLPELDGDILAFLPTERDIRETTRALGGRHHRGQPLEILPLYARLPATDQNRIFAPHQRRRIVLATNVAESSLTVPGIRAVIDVGTARISRYSPRSKVQRLPIEAISRASADQRMGRCGRVGPGICIRLYSQTDYEGRDRYTTPEIRRTNLAAVILQTIALRLGPIDEFPFLDPPRPDAIRDGYKTLFELGAIDAKRQLTSIGRELSRLPVDPRVGRMILAADEENCLEEVLAIAAGLEVRDPRERPPEKKQQADERHAEFADQSSDFLSLLKLWDLYHHWKSTLSRNQLRKACRQNFLSYNRMREWADIYRQLRQMVEQSGRKIGSRQDDYDAIHRALLTGLLSGIAYRSDANRYQGAGGNELFLWPGSALFRDRPKWVVAAELVETNRRYCRVVAKINPGWIERIAEHLVTRTHQDPHWNSRSLSAMIFERVNLFSLPIVPRRRVPLGGIDPETARQLFIQHALVEGELNKSGGQPALDFLEHNRQLIRGTAEAAAKQRRGDWIVSEQAVFEYYDEHLPAHVYDVPRLKKWLKQQRRNDREPLRMQPHDLLKDADAVDRPTDYPDQLSIENSQFPLTYHFSPGDKQDGITITVPQQALNQLPYQRIDWLVPGQVQEKITALIRTLPKSIRRGLVPAPDTAQKAAAALDFGDGPFLATLATTLSRISGESVSAEDFQLDRLPPHLRMKIRLIDQQGKTLAIDDDLERLRSEFGTGTEEDSGEISDAGWEDQETRSWDFGELPEEVTLRRGGITVKAYPAVLDQGERVAVRLVDTADRAVEKSRGGIRRLYLLANKKTLMMQVAHLPNMQEMRLYAASLPGGGKIEARLAELLADRAFLGTEPLPRTADEFDLRIRQADRRIGPAVQELTALARPLLEAYHSAKLAAEHLASSRWQDSAADVRQQLNWLVRNGFLVDTPWEWLQHFPRYFRAIQHRYEKLQHGGHARDQQAVAQLTPWLERYEQRAEQHERRGVVDPELSRFRWMIEEFRVSLFAQVLGTVVSVSDRRLEKQWANVTG
jgi:ATP-dependent helicase HrpA